MTDLESWAPMLHWRRFSVDMVHWKMVGFPTGASFTIVADAFDQASSALSTSP